MNKLLVTGSSGLIGSEVVSHFCGLGWRVHGVDNNMRADFFGAQGDTRWNQQRLNEAHKSLPITNSISETAAVLRSWKTIRPDMIVHAAAQPSHDLAAIAVRRFRRQRSRYAQYAGSTRAQRRTQCSCT